MDPQNNVKWTPNFLTYHDNDAHKRDNQTTNVCNITDNNL